MARKSTPQPLALPQSDSSAATMAQDHDDFIESPRSPLKVASPKSPRSPFRFNVKKSQGELPPTSAVEPPQQTRTNLPPSETTTSSVSAIQNPSGDRESRDSSQERQGRPPRSGFFSNYKASKSSSRLQVEDSMSRDTDLPGMAGNVSSKETSKIPSGTEKTKPRKQSTYGPTKSDASLASSTDSPPPLPTANTIKKNKPKPFSLLNRTKSIRGDDPSPRDPSPTKAMESEKPYVQNYSLKTAPLRSENDRSFRDMMSSSVRQHSEERSASRDIPPYKDMRENGRSQTYFSNSFREGSGHGFLNNLKSSATKGAGAISKGLFGKGGRGGGHENHSLDDEQYTLKVINLPLVEQTRLTRISKRLEDSRDKTEFWMPAFPWRAIDYLNYKGSDVEGLYRVPGSGPQIKRWQRRFDEELDIDLFEQDDLYDINIVGSMLKAWLRELPDELFPKASQDRIARECSGAETVPQLLIDELSNLSPFKYYLLFAITCHLSLLLAHSEKNKMDFRNLCICFQPCMKIDAFCFKFLVCDWRDCWKGCQSEAAYIEQEYMLFDMPPSSAEGLSSTAVESHDERNVSSSDSSKPSSVSIDQGHNKWGHSQNKKQLLFSQSAANSTLIAVQERTITSKTADMRPLSPIKPLSPLGL